MHSKNLIVHAWLEGLLLLRPVLSLSPSLQHRSQVAENPGEEEEVERGRRENRGLGALPPILGTQKAGPRSSRSFTQPPPCWLSLQAGPSVDTRHTKLRGREFSLTGFTVQGQRFSRIWKSMMSCNAKK